MYDNGIMTDEFKKINQFLTNLPDTSKPDAVTFCVPHNFMFNYKNLNIVGFLTFEDNPIDFPPPLRLTIFHKGVEVFKTFHYDTSTLERYMKYVKSNIDKFCENYNSALSIITTEAKKQYPWLEQFKFKFENNKTLFYFFVEDYKKPDYPDYEDGIQTLHLKVEYDDITGGIYAICYNSICTRVVLAPLIVDTLDLEERYREELLRYKLNEL